MFRRSKVLNEKKYLSPKHMRIILAKAKTSNALPHWEVSRDQAKPT